MTRFEKELNEIRSAFGTGATVIDVITGKELDYKINNRPEAVSPPDRIRRQYETDR